MNSPPPGEDTAPFVTSVPSPGPSGPFFDRASGCFPTPQPTRSTWSERILANVESGDERFEISDAAALIISPLRSDTGVPAIIRHVVQKTEEKISLYEVADDSEAIGESIFEFENQVHGMWIVAIYREDKGYIIDPPESFKIRAKDTLIFKAYGKTKRRLRLYEGDEEDQKDEDEDKNNEN